MESEFTTLFKSVFGRFLQNIKAFNYTNGSTTVIDYRLIFNDCSHIRNLRFALNNIGSSNKEKLNHIFETTLIVMLFPRSNKRVEEIIETIGSLVSLVECEKFSDNENLCFVTKYSLKHLPRINEKGIAQKAFLLPIITIKNNNYILLIKKDSYFIMMGDSSTKKPKKFVVEQLEKYLNVSIDKNSRSTVTMINKYRKNVTYKVLNKNITTDYICYGITLTFNDLEKSNIKCLLDRLKNQENNFIIKDDFALIKFDKTNGKILITEQEREQISIANNVPSLLKLRCRSTMV